MAGESSAGFYSGHPPGLASNPMSNNNAISSGGEVISIAYYYNTRVGSVNLSPLDSPQTSHGLKHDADLAVEWSAEEQYKLDEGLAKYANEPNFMRYIKIAAPLRDKTVRDVALRCRWMSSKRRKQDDLSSARKAKDRQDKFVDSSLKNMSLPLSVPLVPHSSTRKHHNHVLSGTSRHLLDENNQILGQVSANLSTLMLLQNIDLFLRTRNNLNTILDDMKNAPGIMNRMPPLNVFLNDELANCLFPRSSQQEQGC